MKNGNLPEAINDFSVVIETAHALVADWRAQALIHRSEIDYLQGEFDLAEMDAKMVFEITDNQTLQGQAIVILAKINDFGN